MLSAGESRALDAIDGAHMLRQTLRWSAINSGSRNIAGLAAMAAELCAAFAPLGDMRLLPAAESTVMAADGRETPQRLGDVLHLSVRPEARTRVLLTGHYDTVFDAAHPFQTPVMLSDGRVNGPGVTDMKGGIAVILAALSAVEAAGMAPGYDVILNPDEEIGSPGSAALLAETAMRVSAGLTYEPALPDGTLASARPGSGNFSVHVAGRAAHAGREPEKGRNAVVAAADLALRLNALKASDLKVNVARIDGGGPNNVVPDSAVLRVNIRPETLEAEARCIRALDAAMAAVAAAHDVETHRHGGFGRPPKPFDGRQQRLFELVRETGADLGLAIGWKPAGGVCDGNNLAATGLAVVDTLGVRGGAIHSADEFLIPESLAERARLSALLLMRIARNGFAR